MIDLDRLEQLAADAGDGLIVGAWWSEDEFAEGFPAPPEADTYLAALDPGVVLALVRAVRAALEHAEYHTSGPLDEALAPFRDAVPAWPYRGEDAE